MSFTQTDIDAMEDALKTASSTNVISVRQGDTFVQYDSKNHLIDAIDYARRQLAASQTSSTSVTRPGVSLARFNKV